MKTDWKSWFAAAGVRAIKTVAQTAVAAVGTTTVLNGIDWSVVISTALMAGVLSLLTSLKGLPELKDVSTD